MSLSKQLYIIISIIFFMIFTGNFIISVKNTKEYLETESVTKAQDTATSLGMSIRNLLKDKTNPEIESIINAIANRGFYKEIRLENSYFSINDSDLLKNTKDLDNDKWEISDVKVDEKIGKIDVLTSVSSMENELNALENPNEVNTTKQADIPEVENSYIFTPSENFKNDKNIIVSFTATNINGKKINATSSLAINNVLVKVSRDVKFDYIPQWFINLIPIDLAEQSSEISDGWQTSAIIYVSANPGDAYAKLYDQVKSASIYALIAFLISMALIFIFVQYILKPLKKLEKLANNIASGKFGLIENLPWTTEIKAVAIAFNDMSTKIEAIINRLNNTLESLSKKLSSDDLTGLCLKQNFETDMKKMFINKSTGYVFIVKIADLASFAKSHTTNEVDNFIKKFAKILKFTKLNDEMKISAYRFFGSEFALIIKNSNYENAVQYAQLLKKEFEALAVEFKKNEIAHIGGTPFNPIGTTPEILQSATQANEKATLIGPNESFITDTNELARDMESWRDLIFDIIDNSKFDVNYIGNCKILNSNDDKVVMQEAFTNIKDKDGNNIPIGTFVSIAEKYEKIVDFDKKVIEKVVNHILINSINHDITINLSLESINNTAFIAWIKNKILESRNIAPQLIFSVTAYAVAKNEDKFKFFADEIHKCGAKIIIKRFESKFIPLGNLKDFNLDYIRLARDYTCDICKDYSKQSFVESISELASLLNIKVLAENVKNDEDIEFLKNYNLYAVSR
jgi:EAL domain-containing protein (putative c-di-GMP-specific phosphodiesterase class I)/GGDEF domain-containing protein